MNKKEINSKNFVLAFHKNTAPGACDRCKQGGAFLRVECYEHKLGGKYIKTVMFHPACARSQFPEYIKAIGEAKNDL